MKEKQIEISPGVTVSSSMALWVKHTKGEYPANDKKSALSGTMDFYETPIKNMENILGFFLGYRSGYISNISIF